MVDGWERWIAQLAKDFGNKVFITGSNSEILQTEFSSLLTGRHEVVQLFPLSFDELPQVQSIILEPTFNIFETEYRIRLKKELLSYLRQGGFPRVVIDNRTSILYQYFRDIVLKDIVLRKRFKNQKRILELGRLLMSENTKLLNKSRIASLLGIKDFGTINDYLLAFEETYLTFEVKKFDYSLQKQIRSHSKFYSIDTGLARSSGFTFSEDIGKAFENLVFLELKRRGFDLYYWHSKKNLEVDFVCRTQDGQFLAVQVCSDISNQEVLSRELNSLKAAQEEIGIEQGIVLTIDQHLESDIAEVIPFANWILQ